MLIMVVGIQQLEQEKKATEQTAFNQTHMCEKKVTSKRRGAHRLKRLICC